MMIQTATPAITPPFPAPAQVPVTAPFGVPAGLPLRRPATGPAHARAITFAPSLPRPPQAPLPQHLPVQAGMQAAAAPGVLDGRDTELLVANLDASHKVHHRAHLFTWSQGLLQGLLVHDALVCLSRPPGHGAPQVDSYSTHPGDTRSLATQLAQDIRLAPRLADLWKARHFEPVLIDRRRPDTPAWAGPCSDLERMGPDQIALHGEHDARGEPTCLFVFTRVGGAGYGPRELHLLRLVTPCLQEAWVRVQMSTGAATRRDSGDCPAAPSPAHAAITAREQQILRWIYLGKSNGEIGQILAISPLTVKNHVQKMLHKLDVVNRAQAVGKALEAHLIDP
ncbi:MAG: hypothetical protein RLZZ584_879 [Pseudomonadota bacterium]|jgi:transcriptional regulator EpsA